MLPTLFDVSVYHLDGFFVLQAMQERRPPSGGLCGSDYVTRIEGDADDRTLGQGVLEALSHTGFVPEDVVAMPHTKLYAVAKVKDFNSLTKRAFSASVSKKPGESLLTITPWKAERGGYGPSPIPKMTGVPEESGALGHALKSVFQKMRDF